MTKGPGRFEFWLIKLDEVLKQAAKTKDPALFLYQNNTRTTLYMLEALAKLYAGIHNRKKFTKCMLYFKAIEDLLGAVDFYDSFSKDFGADASIPVEIVRYTEEKRNEKSSLLNSLLVKKKWINSGTTRTNKIRKKLKAADWQKSSKEIESIENFYRISIEGINDFYKCTGPHFTDLEMQVHSLRRKLRWLSIYPQALNGAVQLSEKEEQDENLYKYLTPEIINSPFNKMPPPLNNKEVLVLNKNYFLSLSWMISELGKIKDKGLRILALAEAIKNTSQVTEEIALQQAEELNKTSNGGLKIVMAIAKEICEVYFKEKNLEKMMRIS